jgi:hypothetical protein
MEYPILSLDAEHNHAAGLAHAQTYNIRPTDGLILVPQTDLGEVKALQIIMGENAVYHLDWDGKISIQLDSTTISILQAENPFDGFKTGRVIIGIGAYQKDESENMLFHVSYALMLDIV